MRVFVVDDHPVMRESLGMFVSSIPRLEVCGVSATGADALTKLATAGADVVLIDISLPGMSGLELLREVKKRWPLLRCLMISGHDNSAYRATATAMGAEGLVSKGNARDLRNALLGVLEAPSAS
jgi:DNA-binding NarL/FixJ family response regulator